MKKRTPNSNGASLRSFQGQRKAAAAILALGLLPCSLSAQVRIWDGEGDAVNWTDALNWTGDEVPDTVGEDAVIDDDPLVDTTVLLDPANGSVLDIGSLTVDDGDTLNVRFDSGTLNVTGGLSNSGTISHSSSPSSNSRTVHFNVTGTDMIFNTATGSILLGTTSGRNRINVVMTLDAQNQNDGSIEATLTTNADRDSVRFRLENSGTFTNNGTILIQDTHSSTSSYSQLQLLTEGADVTFAGSGSVTLDIGTLTDTARARIYGNSGNQTLTNGASHTINGSGQISSNLEVFVNEGLVDATSDTGQFVIASSDSVTNAATGRLVATGAAGLNISNGSSTFVNNGHMEARTGSSISVGSSSATLNGVIAGGGTYQSSTELTGSATLSVGDSSNADGTGTSTIGTLTFSDGLILADTTELNFQLGTAGVGGTDYDLLNVIGSLTLDGILNIEAMGGFDVGTYRLITFTSGELTDNGLTLGDTPSGYTYSLDANDAGGYVDLTVVPEPSSVAMLMGAGALFVAMRRRRNS